MLSAVLLLHTEAYALSAWLSMCEQKASGRMKAERAQDSRWLWACGCWVGTKVFLRPDAGGPASGDALRKERDERVKRPAAAVEAATTSAAAFDPKGKEAPAGIEILRDSAAKVVSVSPFWRGREHNDGISTRWETASVCGGGQTSHPLCQGGRGGGGGETETSSFRDHIEIKIECKGGTTVPADERGNGAVSFEANKQLLHRLGIYGWPLA